MPPGRPSVSRRARSARRLRAVLLPVTLLTALVARVLSLTRVPFTMRCGRSGSTPPAVLALGLARACSASLVVLLTCVVDDDAALLIVTHAKGLRLRGDVAGEVCPGVAPAIRDADDALILQALVVQRLDEEEPHDAETFLLGVARSLISRPVRDTGAAVDLTVRSLPLDHVALHARAPLTLKRHQITVRSDKTAFVRPDELGPQRGLDLVPVLQLPHCAAHFLSAALSACSSRAVLA